MNLSPRKIAVFYKAWRAYRAKADFCDYPPIRAWIDVTSVCNLRCVMCPNKSQPAGGKGYMELALFKSLIDQLKEYSFEIYLFLSGEPLLHKDIAEMIEYVSRSGLRSVLHTNATRLTPEISEKILRSGLDKISFSFDSPDKKAYESVRVGAEYGTTLANIRTFLELKKKLGLVKPWTVLQMIEFKDAGKRSEYRALFENLPVDEFRFLRPHTFGGEYQEHSSIKGSEYAPCTFLWYSMNILPDGRVVPCCVDFGGKIVLGDANREKLADIWNNGAYRGLRRALAEGRYKETGLCGPCDILWKKKVFGIPYRYAWDFIKENFLQ